MALKTSAPAGLQLDVAEELRALRVQGLKHVAAIAELRTRVSALEGRWSAPTITAWAAIVTAIGTLVYLLVNHQ